MLPLLSTWIIAPPSCIEFILNLQDILAGNYEDVFVASLSSVSAQVEVEDDDVLLVDSEGNSE